MRLLDRLMKLLLASLVAGAMMRYAVPAEMDIFTLSLDFTYNLVYLQHVGLSPGMTVPGDYTISLMILPVAVAPLIYAAFSGKWAVLTYLLGFFAGYLMTDYLLLASLLTLLVGVAIFATGFFAVLYTRSLKVKI